MTFVKEMKQESWDSELVVETAWELEPVLKIGFLIPVLGDTLGVEGGPPCS